MSTREPNQLQATGGRRVPVLVLPLGGAFSTDVEDAVYRAIPVNNGDIRLRSQGRLMGMPLVGTGFITTADARRIRRRIEDQLRPYDRSSPDRALLLVGKSAGGISLWNTLRLHYREIAGWVQRCALVLIDPHGAAFRDGESGTYAAGQNLTWPPNWDTDTSRFRVYNIFQQRFPGLGGHMTGASFPRAFMNVQLTDTRSRRQGGLDHMNITQHPKVHNIIAAAYNFARTGM